MTTPSNEDVGRQLGVSHATVSRYKSGSRFPELTAMARIAEVYGWTMDDQYAAKEKGTFASEFSERVAASASVGALVEGSSQDQ